MVNRDTIFNFLLLFLLIVWQPFQIFILKIDGAGKTLMLLSVFVFFIIAVKQNLGKRIIALPYIFWLFWLFYSLTNALFKGHYHANIVQFFFYIFYPFVVLIIFSTIDFKYQLNKIDFIISSLYIYLLLCMFDITAIAHDRLGGQLNANMIGIHCMAIIFFASLKFITNKIRLYQVIAICTLPVVVSLVTASRKAFAAMFFIALVTAFFKYKEHLKKSIVYLLLGVVCIVFVTKGILENTEIGQRFLSTSGQSEQYALLETGTILDKFGDRGVFYYYGWKVFKENSVTGVGLGNFIKQGYLDYLNHSEYMTQLCEGGIVGTVLFCCFYYWIAKRLFLIGQRNRANHKKYSVIAVYTSGYIAVLFLNFSTWTYSMIPVFLILGEVIMFIRLNENNKEKKEKGPVVVDGNTQNT